MTQAALRTITKRLIPHIQPGIAAHSDFLRALVEEADVLGRDPDGYYWLLTTVPPQIMDELFTLDSHEREDSDDDGGGHYDLQGRNVSEDHEFDDPAEDNGDYEPEYR